jgi:hypothetical protein
MLFNRQYLPVPTPLERSGAVILVKQKVFEGSEEKCAKPTLLPVRAAQCVLLEKMDEKTLDEILCISGRMAAMPKKSVKWRPISFAKSRKCTLRGWLQIGFPRTQHDRPMRRLKRSTAFL